MFSWCTEKEWCSEEFDLDWLANERGMFATADEAFHNAKKHGYENVLVVEID